MITYDPIAKIEAPVARPSRPSATFTPFEVAVTIAQIHRMNTMVPPATPKSSTKFRVLPFGSTSRSRETAVEAGVTRSVAVSCFGNCSASSAKTVATRIWPAIFAQPPSPRLRWWRVFRKSSVKPTSPSPTMRNSTSSPDGVTLVPPVRWPTK